tara:strand:+ start:599 stop:829 length:231 start_codon:yes stop_codon:yes gene_type:complete
MIYKELARLIDYDIPCIEFYNKQGELEYTASLENFEFVDIDIILHEKYEPFGIIKLRRNEKTQFNDKGVQPSKGKL